MILKNNGSLSGALMTNGTLSKVSKNKNLKKFNLYDIITKNLDRKYKNDYEKN